MSRVERERENEREGQSRLGRDGGRGGVQAEGDRMISLKRRRMRRRSCRGQRRIDDLLSGLYNLGSWEI